MKKHLFILLALCVFTQLGAQTTYRNPVIAGDLPDPSVIRVGDTYFAAGTSSEWAVPYRLFESKDLVNWQYIGGLFKEMPSWTMGSYWAPELFYRNETYYVYYTARRKSDKQSYIGVASTKNIREGFTDHGLIIEWTKEAIDAFVIELDGKLYITWKAYGLDNDRDIEILGAELSADGLKVTGEAFTVIKTDREGWESGGLEGQYLLKHNDYLYMFYAGNSCCGRNCNYMTGVARAKSIRGPWEKYSGNPILYGDEHFRCSGHGTLVETPDQRYFYLYHAYDANTNVYLGRQGMLDEVIWDKTTGWPAFRYGVTPSLQAETPIPNTVQANIPDFLADFTKSQLCLEWIWDVSQAQPKTSIANGKLSLQATETPTGSFLGLRVKKGNYTLTVDIPESKNVQTGICIYGTSKSVIGLSVENNTIELWKVKEGKRTILATHAVQSYPVSLTLHTQFGQYGQFGIQTKDTFQPIGSLQHIEDIPQWDRPPMVGIQAKGKTTGTFSKVSLRYNE